MTIAPFRIDIAQTAIDDFHERLDRTRWPEEAPGEGWSRGVPIDYLKALSAYWREGFDWRAQEARLNVFPQFITQIDGQTVHFLHVKSGDETATPLMLVHGWPGSFVEFIDLIGPLVDPAGHGAAGAPAFDLVIPSLPGFGFSHPLVGEGWTYRRIAQTCVELMRRLGYDRYGVQGGDVGAFVGPEIGRVAPDNVIGVHANAMVQIPSMVQIGVGLVTLSSDERERLDRFKHFNDEMRGYDHIQGTRPKTLAFGLTDSPVGQLAWIIEKFKEWSDPSAESPEDAIDRDLLLTNASLYWFTGTAGSSANLYYETKHDPAGTDKEKNPVPTGVALSSTQDVTIRKWAEHENNIVHWTEFERGGHFLALEAPEALAKDIRAFFSGLSTP
ncbi:epoxide hydrolase family protein [Brucella sp. JSBI001]|uniref:epoxide hydrolase family protein n=1 Tax=Brucella sp. JSBI001 TaxID=2886044 RepID=UPI00222FC02F|nr:epoxide hydrolase family protein [Brucella sp. JSBI001]UZD69374.1 epoxide hydrolase [Brucella sp. JSBI001]